MTRILLLAFMLASCGGDDGGSSSSSSSGFFSFIGADPYIVDGVFYYDQNNNGLFDQGELVSTLTDANGNGSFSSIIPAGGRIVQFQGGVMDGFNYNGKLKGISNGSGGIVLSPLTTLSANGFSNQQIINLLNEVGITITEDQITQNPMTDPNLLRAAMSVSQGMLASLKGFDLAPSDATFSEEGGTINEPYAQQLFAQASEVYGQVITQGEFNANLNNLSKMASSFSNYMFLYGASDFSSPTAVESAKSSIDSVVNESQSSFEPVSLIKTTEGFTAKVVSNNWFDYKAYDLIGLDFLNIYTRIVDNTIGNYPFSPWRVEINFAPATITANGMQVQSSSTRQTSWTLDSDNNMIFFKGIVNQGNGEPPDNAQLVDGLPISTYDRSSTAILRGLGVVSTGTINESNLRLVGDGDAILTYYGIDWGATPTDMNEWKVNQSRTNNCIAGDKPIENCLAKSVTKFYDSKKENADYKSFNALTIASDYGNPFPSNTQLKFVVRNQPLGSTTTSAPVEYTLSEFILEKAKLIHVEFGEKNCLNPKGCLAVQADDDPESRPPLNNTEDISFIVGYENFPTDYKVYAISKISIKTDTTDPISCNTHTSSSFFKANMIVLKIACDAEDKFPNLEYLFLDLTSRVGLMGSYDKVWLENGVEKFKYRNFNMVNLKEVIP